jgi:hypothetical protein
MGSEEDRRKFVGQVKKGCRIAKLLRDMGVRPNGVVRIDSASSVEEWSKDPAGNTGRIAETFRQACDVAADYGERLAAEGEICWGGMHSWKNMVELLELVDRPKTIGFQADMAHTLLYILGYNAPEDAILPADWDWSDPARFDEALNTLTAALRPWTIDFHIAQNDGTVKGSGTHDKTGHHCLAKDPNGKLDIPRHAGYWLRDKKGELTKAFRHICWDGCMFPNETMMKPQTWNDILAAMIAVREAHGWREAEANQAPAEPPERPTVLKSRPSAKRAKKKLAKKAGKKAPARLARKAPKARRQPASKKTARKPAKLAGRKAPKALRTRARKPARKAPARTARRR